MIPKFQQLTIDAYAGPKCRIHLTNAGHHDSINTPEMQAAFHEMLEWMWAKNEK